MPAPTTDELAAEDHHRGQCVREGTVAGVLCAAFLLLASGRYDLPVGFLEGTFLAALAGAIAGLGRFHTRHWAAGRRSARLLSWLVSWTVACAALALALGAAGRIPWTESWIPVLFGPVLAWQFWTGEGKHRATDAKTRRGFWIALAVVVVPLLAILLVL